ncbi:MAG: hypothetical protein ACT4QF_21900 [Sporichthyaceae bacterium]
MSQLTRRALASVAVALTCALAPTASAGAADVRTPHPKPAAAAKNAKPAKPNNTMVVCNHSGYLLGVYSMGPGDVRRADLSGSHDECVTWKRLASGFHDVGFNFRVPSQQNVILEMRIKYDGYTVYKRLGGGSTLLQLGGDKTAKIDYFIPRG